MKHTPSRRGASPSRLFVAVVVIAALYLARVVFVPLALALLVSLLLNPVVSFLEHVKVPRILAILLVVLLLVGGIGFGGWKTSQQIVELTQQLPSYRKILDEKIHWLQGSQNQSFSQASNMVHDLANEIESVTPGSSVTKDSQKAPAPPGSSASKPMAVEVVPPTNPVESFQSMLGPVATAGVVAIFTIFILMGREDLRSRFIRLAGGSRVKIMAQALDEATHRINHYLLLQLLVNVSYAVVIGFSLHFLGIPHASLWGVSAGILRFIPYAGPPMAALMPILLSLAVFSGWTHAALTVALFFVLELLISNFIEPLLYGAHVGLAPLAILVAAIFWTLIWGLPGLVLSTPLTVCLVVMGLYIPGLEFLNVLLGDEPALPPHIQYYQRLLAKDHDGARNILVRSSEEKCPAELCHAVVIPALALAEQDRHRDELDEETQRFIFEGTREIVEEILLARSKVPGELNHPVSATSVLCIPARDDADALIATLLAHLLGQQGVRAEGLPVLALPETISLVTEAKPTILCISALPPFAFNHARELYAKMRTRFPEIYVIICLWNLDENRESAVARLKLAANHEFFTTLPQVLAHLSDGLQKPDQRR
jgi:predicted PurR-regulated permease PerM